VVLGALLAATAGVVGLVQTVSSAPPAEAAVACTPTAGFNNCQDFTYTGANQTFLVPKGVTSVNVNLAGAGSTGRLGGRTTGTLAVTGGQTLNVTVGQAGATTPSVGAFGGGGAGGSSNLAGTTHGQGGGGMTALWAGAVNTPAAARLIAGGAGGTGGTTTAGGAGGGSSGSAGSGAGGGGGGTQTSGGAPGANCSSGFNNTPGGQFGGGTGASVPFGFNSVGGGGGGGGWWGGGGGGCSASTRAFVGGGGGGSGFTGPGVTGGSTVVGTGSGGNGTARIQWFGPAPVITSPTSGTQTTDTTPTITGTGVAGTNLTVTNGGVTVCTAVVLADSSWTCTPATPMTLGAKSLVATQVDPAVPTAIYASSTAVPITIVADTVLSAAKSVALPADGNIRPGDAFAYSVTVTNAGPSPAANVTASDTLPAMLTFVSSTSGCTAAGQVVSCGPVASVAVGANTVFTFTVLLNPGYTGDGSDVVNTASATSPTCSTCPTTSPATPLPPGSFQTADAALTPLKSVVVPADGNIRPADTFDYQVAVTNNGPSTATAVTASDTLPAMLAFVSSTSGCTAAAQVV
jgi:uncharacterized repeat protein (TIGR01451 family)